MAGTQNITCVTSANENVTNTSSSSEAGSSRSSTSSSQSRIASSTRISSDEAHIGATKKKNHVTGVFTSSSDVPSPALDENKVRDYLLKEISTETRELEAQAIRVNEELSESLRLLRQLKRSVVSQYYASSRSNVRKHPAIVKVEEEEAAVSGGETSKVFGSAANVNEGLATRKSARKRTMPQPTVGEPSRPLVTLSLRFYVGTMCKYLGNSDTGLSTHKWTVYLRNCDTNKENICHHIAKVTFILHDSYKPHNVVKVRKEPFKITREGWGEFSMKIHISFSEREHNRNVELVHPVNFLHVKSAIPVISLETPIDIELTTSQFHTVIKEDEKVEGSNNKQEIERGEEGKTNEKMFDKRNERSGGEGGSGEVQKKMKVERERKRSEPDLRQTVLEYLTDEDMMMMDERLDQDIDIT